MGQSGVLCCKVLYTCFVCISSIILVSLAGVLLGLFNSDITQMQLVVDNWKQEPLIDLQVVSSSQCPLGYNPLFIYTWPGTEAGCLCVNGELREGACCNSLGYSTSSDDGDCPCQGQDVPAQDPIKMTQWELPSTVNSMAPFTVCGKTLAKYSYMRGAPESPRCAPDEHQCGGNDPNQFSLFCVPQGQICPITSINFTNIMPSDLTKAKPIPGTSYWVQYTRDEINKVPISQGRYDSDLGVCQDSSQYNIAKFSDDYMLQYDQRERCAKTDDRYIKLQSSLTEQQFYSINANFNFPTRFPDFQFGQTSYSAYYRSYISVDFSCRGYLGEMDKRMNGIGQVQGVMIVLVVFSGLLCGVSVLLDSWMQYSSSLGSKEYYGYIVWDKNFFCNKFAFFCKFVCLTVCFFDWIVVMVRIGSLRRFLEHFLSENCLDDQTTTVFGSIRDGSHVELAVIYLLILLAYIALDPNFFYYHWWVKPMLKNAQRVDPDNKTQPLQPNSQQQQTPIDAYPIGGRGQQQLLPEAKQATARDNNQPFMQDLELISQQQLYPQYSNNPNTNNNNNYNNPQQVNVQVPVQYYNLNIQPAYGVQYNYPNQEGQSQIQGYQQQQRNGVNNNNTNLQVDIIHINGSQN